MHEASEQVQSMTIQSTQITFAQRHAVAIEEFEDLDRDLAAVSEAVAKVGSVEPTALGLGGDVGCNRDHLADCLPQEEMIVRDLVGPTEAAREFQQAAHVALGGSLRCRDVTHARRPEALIAPEQRRNGRPGRFVGWREANLVRREPDEGAFESDLAGLR